MNILIAEDNKVVQLLHQQLMNDWQYNFDMASNGVEALELVRSNANKYDICLMDVEMPKMNGIEATRAIRKSGEYFPIIALTANKSCKVACLDVGMDEFIEKPCLPAKLRSLMNRLVVKWFQIVKSKSRLHLTEVGPMDQKHAQELRKLKSLGLVKMRLDGPDEREVITHRNVPNKISHDFNVMKYSMTEFLNRDPDRPTVCDLYRGSRNCIVETFVDHEDYDNEMAREDEALNSFTEKYFKKEEE